MSELKRIAVVIFSLPDGRLVLQRRTIDAPIAAGKLGFFGGHFELGEDPLTCIKREVAEETSLDVNTLNFTGGRELLIPKSAHYSKDRQFYIYEAAIASDDFEVFEGDRSESFTIEELLTRDDISETVRIVLEDAK